MLDDDIAYGDRQPCNDRKAGFVYHDIAKIFRLTRVNMDKCQYAARIGECPCSEMFSEIF